MQAKSDIQRGWDFAVQVLGADVAANEGEKYVKSVAQEITNLEDAINNPRYRNLGINQLQGNMFEEWSAGTFNVDAAAAGSTDRAAVLHSTVKDSVDIELRSGQEYSAKSYVTAEKTAKAQARFNPEAGRASYLNQKRLVPTDQLEEAKKIARREQLRNESTRKLVSKAYAETEANLTDKVRNSEGVESKAVSRKELEKIAKESKRQDFKAEGHGVTVEGAIKPKYLVKQSLKAGVTAAAITAALEMAPEVFKAIDSLVKNGELDPSQLRDIGAKGIRGGVEGFLSGAIAATVNITLAKSAVEIDPTHLAAMVTVVVQTAIDSIQVARGKMSARQMGAKFIDCVVFLCGSVAGPIIASALGFSFPVSLLLGSLIGTSFCVIYQIGKRNMISLSIDTGFTCFGLVEQDYQIPQEVLRQIGVETIEIPRTRIDIAEIPLTAIEVPEVEQANYETIDFTVLRRGLISVNKVGYLMNK